MMEAQKLTKREHFALEAMKALLSNTENLVHTNKEDFKNIYEEVTYVATLYADNLIMTLEEN